MKKLDLLNKRKYIIVVILVLIFNSLLYVLFIKTNLKNATIEAGTEKISIDMFLKKLKNKSEYEFVTNVNKINLNKVGNYIIKIKRKNQIKEVKLFIRDTTPPKVQFKDVINTLGYEINPNDFITKIKEFSKYDISYEIPMKLSIDDYGEYEIVITVKDEYGNKTSKKCKLAIGWLKQNVDIEIGTTDIKELMVYNPDTDVEKIPDELLKNIDTKKIGTYKLEIPYNNKNYPTIINIIDTIAPTLELRDVTVYEQQEVDINNFIEIVEDNSSEYQLKLLTKIESKYGSQNIIIEAKDNSGNSTKKTAKLTRKKDDISPEIKGLTDLSLPKNNNYDFYSNVKAIDNVDGIVDFKVDLTNLDKTKAGTYYITYTATDSNNNKNTKKRKIIIIHDETDTDNLITNLANSLSNDIPTIVEAVRNSARYSNSWGGDDPVWYGLTEKRGNCFVHAKILEKVLSKKGYSNILIYNYDKSHYWNLVNVNGSWKHVDSTPGNPYVLLNDEEMATKPPVYKGGGWDTTIFPAAN